MGTSPRLSYGGITICCKNGFNSLTIATFKNDIDKLNIIMDDSLRIKKMFINEGEYTLDKDRYRVEVQSRVLRSLKYGIKFNADIERSENYLRRWINSKASLVVFYADLVNSTVMSNMLPVKRLATIIQTFYQEMTFIINNYNGYVLKYVGDAVLAYFPTEKNYYLACDTAVECSFAMIDTVNQGINPILADHGYPELQVKIGMDAGEHAVIQYAEGSHIDIIGYPISMAAKITELSKPNHVSISNNIYQALHPRLREMFHEDVSKTLSNYTDSKGEPYKLYST